MSVVAVRINDKDIEFAADSIAVRGWTKQTNKDFSKLEEINGMLIGGAGSSEEINLLFMFAKTHSPLTCDEKGLLDFIFEFYKWKESLGTSVTLIDTVNSTYTESEFIIGYQGKAFFVQRLLVKEITEYQAIGAGMDYALAVLWLGYSAEKAVQAACELCCYVAEPVKVKRMKREGINDEL